MRKEAVQLGRDGVAQLARRPKVIDLAHELDIPNGGLTETGLVYRRPKQKYVLEIDRIVVVDFTIQTPPS